MVKTFKQAKNFCGEKVDFSGEKNTSSPILESHTAGNIPSKSSWVGTSKSSWVG
jgi:hypothetical protein